MKPTTNEFGELHVSDEVIADYVYDVARNTPGIYSFSGGLSDTLSKNLLGKELRYKGIKVSQDDEKVTIDIYVVVDYGVVIPDVAWNAQKAIQAKLETVTDKTLEKINVHVQGVNFEEDDDE